MEVHGDGKHDDGSKASTGTLRPWHRNAVPLLRRPTSVNSIDLAFGGQLTLWALRLWLGGDREYQALHHTLCTGFSLVCLPRAYIALDQFLSIVVYGHGCALATGHPSSRDLTPDEQLFLGFVADQQEGAIVAAYQTLLTWINSGDRRAAMAMAMDYAMLLASRNLKALHLHVAAAAPRMSGHPSMTSDWYH